ncbi:hypothetical protein Bhyg_08718 [Pseudolycoriella hygida]|uniref:Uncharacterized protein n=1 Tax=Pseudolycoriella hygida TaxID=35572 RepID=A0A9Q0S4L2_9DIPT|nr:hypothetical protein Bhyg_08718 [Pseudolycoriella hygida]
MLLKYFISLVVLVKIANATHAENTEEKKISFSVANVWQSYSKAKRGNVCPSPPEDDEFKQGVQEYYDGCRRATWKFHGQSYHFADVVMTTMEDYFSKLMYFSNSNSTVLTTSSIALLHSMSKCNKLRKSGLIIIREFNKVLPDMLCDFDRITTKLKHVIGRKMCSVFNRVVADLGETFLAFMRAFLKTTRQGSKHGKNVSYVKVFKKAQTLMNTVALVAKTLLNELHLATQEVYEGVTVLTLIFYFFAYAVQGINSCVQDYLYLKERPVSKIIKASSEALEYVIVEVSQAVAAIVFPFTASIKNFLTILVNVAKAFNKAVEDILGPFHGVSTTVKEIQINFSHVIKTITSKGASKVLKGIRP